MLEYLNFRSLKQCGMGNVYMQLDPRINNGISRKRGTFVPLKQVNIGVTPGKVNCKFIQ
jgi:hypothetical protein